MNLRMFAMGGRNYFKIRLKKPVPKNAQAFEHCTAKHDWI